MRLGYIQQMCPLFKNWSADNIFLLNIVRSWHFVCSLNNCKTLFIRYSYIQNSDLFSMVKLLFERFNMSAQNCTLIFKFTVIVFNNAFYLKQQQRISKAVRVFRNGFSGVFSYVPEKVRENWFIRSFASLELFWSYLNRVNEVLFFFNSQLICTN